LDIIFVVRARRDRSFVDFHVLSFVFVLRSHLPSRTYLDRSPELFVARDMPVFTQSSKREFDELYAKARSMGCGARSQLVSAGYRMIDMLIVNKRAQTNVQMHSKRVGIHPKNRGGKKMQHTAMYKKGVKIIKVGYSKKLCGPDRAIAFENNPKTNNCDKHTIDVTNTSEFFAKYESGTIRAGAVGCTHLNQFIAAIADGVKCPAIYTAELCDQGSDRLSKDILTHNNDEFCDGVASGLRWTLIDADVEVDYPDLPDIFQRALNVEHNIGEGADTTNQKNSNN
jgi:hypothetical protein